MTAVFSIFLSLFLCNVYMACKWNGRSLKQSDCTNRQILADLAWTLILLEFYSCLSAIQFTNKTFIKCWVLCENWSVPDQFLSAIYAYCFLATTNLSLFCRSSPMWITTIFLPEPPEISDLDELEPRDIRPSMLNLYDTADCVNIRPITLNIKE